MGWKQYRDLDLLQAEIWKFKQEFSAVLWHGSQMVGVEGTAGFNAGTVLWSHGYPPDSVCPATSSSTTHHVSSPSPDICWWMSFPKQLLLKPYCLQPDHQPFCLQQPVRTQKDMSTRGSNHQHLDFHCRLYDCFDHWSLLEIRKIHS